MKIITWNCNMAFRKKASSVLEMNPDILVIPECENRERLLFPPNAKKPNSVFWAGVNPHKGIGIFAYNNYRFKLDKSYTEDIRYVIPLKITAPGIKLNLLAIWANNPKDPDGCYVEQVWKGIQHYKKLLKKKNTILAGDFNSNKIWDAEHRKWSHSSVVEELGKKGITSAYHHHFKEDHGAEKGSTLYMYRHANKPYHIDYCFLSADLMRKIRTVEIGLFDIWIKYSDHLPLIIHLD